MEWYLLILINKLVYYVLGKLFVHLFKVLFMTPGTPRIIKVHLGRRNYRYVSRMVGPMFCVGTRLFMLDVCLQNSKLENEFPKKENLQSIILYNRFFGLYWVLNLWFQLQLKWSSQCSTCTGLYSGYLCFIHLLINNPSHLCFLVLVH